MGKLPGVVNIQGKIYFTRASKASRHTSLHPIAWQPRPNSAPRDSTEARKKQSNKDQREGVFSHLLDNIADHLYRRKTKSYKIKKKSESLVQKGREEEKHLDLQTIQRKLCKETTLQFSYELASKKM